MSPPGSLPSVPSLAGCGPTYFNGHDGTTLGVPHLLHHPIGSTAQLRDGHQVIGLHLKVLGGQKREKTQVRRLPSHLAQQRELGQQKLKTVL